MKKSKPKSKALYNFQVWWKPVKSKAQQRKASDPLRAKILSEIKTFERSPEFLAKKADRFQMKTLADYFLDAQLRELDECDSVFTPEELLRIKIITLTNHRAEEIKALILKLNNRHKWIIALHGWGENKYSALHQSYLFAQLGFNVLTFDAKGHGQSYGEETDFGFESHKDLAFVISYLRRNHGMNHYGIVGWSAGASTALRHLQKIGYQDPQLKFVVSDCGFANLNQQLKFLFEQRYPSSWWKFSYLVRNKFKKYFGFEPKAFDLVKEEEMARIAHIPILFVHGEADQKVKVENAYKLYEQKIGFENPQRSQLLIIPKADHQESLSVGNNLYNNEVVKFLKTIHEI